MVKRILALLCAALLMISAAGCGTQVPEETTEPTLPPPAEVEVPYEPETEMKKYEGVQLRLLATMWDTEPEAMVMQQAAEFFQRTTGAQVQILWAADPAAGLTGCDIFQASVPMLKEGLLSEALDLGPMAEAAGYQNKSYESLRRQVMDRCGYLAGIPQIPRVGGIYYLQDTFTAAGIQAVPGSWTEFLDICQTLTDAGYEPLALNSEDAALAAYLHLERSVGASGLVKMEEEKRKFAEDEVLVDAAQQIVDLVAGGNVLTAAYPSGWNKLGLSNAAMTVGDNDLCAAVEEACRMDLRWGVFPWPGTGAGTGSYVSSDLLCVSAGSENPQAAFDFIMLLCTGDFDQLRADVSGGIGADPANTGTIRGAKEILSLAGGFDGSLPDYGDTDVFARLWNGKYKTGLQFAQSWDKAY